MNKAFTFLFVLFSSLCLAQPDNGLLLNRHANGQTASRGHYKDGQKSGKWEYWTERGRLYLVENYKEGAKNGKIIYYGANGKPELSGNYKAGAEDGEWRGFYESGAVRFVKSYTAGKLNGKALYFTAGGQKQKEENYADGLMDGDCLVWYENGQLAEQLHYSKGKLHGETKRFDKNGKQEQSAVYENGELNGIFLGWQKGVQVEKTTYLHGKKNGVSMLWDEKGDTLSIRHFRNDIPEGLFVDFRDRKRSREMTYVNGVPEGPARFYDASTGALLYINWLHEGKPDSVTNYYPTGKKQSLITYGADGLRNGNYTEWFEDGKVKITGYYMNGERQFIWKSFYPGGAIEWIAAYQFGDLVETFTANHPSGKKKLEQLYRDGKPSGPAKIWDEKGKPVAKNTPLYQQMLEASLPK